MENPLQVVNRLRWPHMLGRTCMMEEALEIQLDPQIPQAKF
jgi:hypothetical protein